MPRARRLSKRKEKDSETSLFFFQRFPSSLLLSQVERKCAGLIDREIDERDGDKSLATKHHGEK